MKTLLHALLVALAVALVAASFLPFIETEWWAVRLLAFPRLQIAVGLVVLGLALVPFGRRAPWATAALLFGIVAALGANAASLWPYRPSGERDALTCPAERRLSVLVANVLLGNRQADKLLEEVRTEQPDLFLAMETDSWWDAALAPLKESMPHTVEKLTGSYYGIQLYSRLPLVRPEIRFLAGRETPSVVTAVRLRTGELVDFIGLHPKPPQPWQSALGRDAELYAAALLLRDKVEPGILAGDLNATPWETAVDRSRRVARLIDPRRGYGYVPTFSATSPLMSWPLDHVFHEGGFTAVAMKRLEAFGSDHYPFLVRLCRVPDPVGEAPPEPGSDDLAAVRAVLSAAPAPSANGSGPAGTDGGGR